MRTNRTSPSLDAAIKAELVARLHETALADLLDEDPEPYDSYEVAVVAVPPERTARLTAWDIH